MKITKLICLVVFLLPTPVLACKDLNWSIEEWVDGSSAIYVGIITGLSIPEIEDKEFDLSNVHRVISRQNKEVRLLVVERLKGMDTKFVNATLHWCTGGFALAGEVVVLFRRGDVWHSKPGMETITAVKSVL